MDKYFCTREKSPFSLGQSQRMPLPWCGWKEVSMHWCPLMSLHVWAVLASSEHPEFNTPTAQNIHSLVRVTPEGPLLTTLALSGICNTHPLLSLQKSLEKWHYESAWKSLPEAIEDACTGMHKWDTGNQRLLCRSSGLQQHRWFRTFPLHWHS